jgi:hypothetical protein
MDANQNGLIDPAEVNPRFRFFLERAARDANLDLNQPIPVAKLEEAMTQGRERMMRERMGDSSSSSSSRPDDRRSSDSSTKIAPKTTPLVPGFGTTADLKPVPGFGDAAAAAATSTASSTTSVAQATSSDDRRDRREERDRGRGRDGDRDDSSGAGAASSTSSNTSSSPPSGNPDDQVRRYATSLHRQYDANKNGTLERDEWGKMASSLNAAKGDKDGDGNLTLDEFSAHFAEQNSRGGSSSSSSSGSSGSGGGFGGGRSGGRGSSSSRSNSNSNSGRPNRFLTPTERLPEGLPSWFSRNDRNADGQISMAEYSTSWSESQLREFNRYDVNGDGMVTPAECLAVERR